MPKIIKVKFSDMSEFNLQHLNQNHKFGILEGNE